SSGLIVYTTHGSQMMDYFSSGHMNFSMAHEEMKVISSDEIEEGIILKTAVSRFSGKEFLVCSKALDSKLFAELRIRKEFVLSSAKTANEFIAIVATFCFLLSIIWVFVFARKFSLPIAKMSEITKDMSDLKFDRKLLIEGGDEIGQLAVSINEMSDSLSTALNELSETNAKLRDEIELERQLDAMRREFVANVSHELKTPLAIINGYAEGLKLNINADAKEQYLGIIIDEGQRMNRLVMSLLELSRYESGQIPLNLQSFDICIMATEMLSKIFFESNITVENKLTEGFTVYADPLQIEQVLKSYLENAKSHTNDGGSVRIFYKQTGENTVRICVYNSGSSVDEELMPQIWQSFYRGDTSHKREQSRFGLGLSIVGAICKLHGKSCGVYNTDGGVCFWFECDIMPLEG
ncbi:MAG: HAMP domain-containing histidine kinase, partial [Clostridia bacterium]|nr:HAMP domain-containing histidine kinase [Clostridia bacterium]